MIRAVGGRTILMLQSNFMFMINMKPGFHADGYPQVLASSKFESE